MSPTQSNKGKGKRKISSEIKVIQEMNNIIEEALATKKYTQILEFPNELIGECMKLKAYGYYSYFICAGLFKY